MHSKCQASQNIEMIPAPITFRLAMPLHVHDHTSIATMQSLNQRVTILILPANQWFNFDRDSTIPASWVDHILYTADKQCSMKKEKPSISGNW